MAYTGFYDAISLALAVKLLALAMGAAFSDSWHPAFHRSEVTPNLVLLMVAVFAAMLLALLHLIALCLAIFVTEAARAIAPVMSGACAFLYTLALLLFSGSLAVLSSPWLLAMLTSPLAALTAHQVLIHLKKLPECPVYKLALSCLLLLMSVLSVSLRHWWAAGSRLSLAQAAPTVGLFALPPGGGAKALQACAVLTLLTLLLLLALCAVAFAVSRAWLPDNPLGEAAPAYLGIGLAGAALVFAVTGAVAYSSVSHFTNSLLAAVCLGDSVLCVLYQLFSTEAVPTEI